MAEKQKIPFHSKIVFERQRGGWVFHAQLASGGTNVPIQHRTFEDALAQLRQEYDLTEPPLGWQ
jgi:hypothetical protein